MKIEATAALKEAEGALLQMAKFSREQSGKDESETAKVIGEAMATGYEGGARLVRTLIEAVKRMEKE